MILQQHSLKRVFFDPTNVEHRVAYKVFLDTGRWVVNFFCEHPHASIVSCVERKIVEHALQDVNKAAGEISKNILDDRESRKGKSERIGGDVVTIIKPRVRAA